MVLVMLKILIAPHFFPNSCTVTSRPKSLLCEKDLSQWGFVSKISLWRANRS